MSLTRAAQLADLGPEDVEAWFVEAEPEHVVSLVDAASDKELSRLAGRDHLRRTAVRTVLSRLGEFAIEERLAAVSGVVAFHVTPPRGRPERHVLGFDGTGVRLLGEAHEETPDVSLTVGAVDFLRMVTGGVNAAVLLLGARLDVEGDADLALRVGGVFKVPGRPGVAVDPDEVDPEEIAAVLKGVKDAHLRAVMQGGFRDVVIEQVFRRLPDFLVQERAAEADLSVGFKITGRLDGGDDRWLVEVRDGTCTVERDGRARDATLVLDGASFLKLVTGHLNPVTGVMRGAVKVRGEVAAGLALHRMMRIPGR